MTIRLYQFLKIFIVILLSNTLVAAQDEVNNRIKIAVYITASNTLNANVKKVINNQTVSILQKTKQYQLIERQDDFIQQITQEQKLQYSGVVDDKQITSLGKGYGADAVCIVEVTEMQKGQLSIDMRIVNVEKTLIISAGSADGKYTGVSSVRKIVAVAINDMLFVNNNQQEGIIPVNPIIPVIDTLLPPSQLHKKGLQYYNGRDYTNAIRYFIPAAQEGYAPSQGELGNCYYYGQGVPQNAATAVYWYREAAAKGYVEAQKNLGICYDFGRGVIRDKKQAIYWYRKAAKKGNGEAQDLLRQLNEK